MRLSLVAVLFSLLPGTAAHGAFNNFLDGVSTGFVRCSVVDGDPDIIEEGEEDFGPTPRELEDEDCDLTGEAEDHSSFLGPHQRITERSHAKVSTLRTTAGPVVAASASISRTCFNTPKFGGGPGLCDGDSFRRTSADVRLVYELVVVEIRGKEGFARASSVPLAAQTLWNVTPNSPLAFIELDWWTDDNQHTAWSPREGESSGTEKIALHYPADTTFLRIQLDADCAVGVPPVNLVDNGEDGEACSVLIAPEIEFDQTAFDRTQGEATFQLDEFFRIQVSVNVTASPDCGDGSLGAGEVCDDGNFNRADRCDNACRVAGLACPAAPAFNCFDMNGRLTLNERRPGRESFNLRMRPTSLDPIENDDAFGNPVDGTTGVAACLYRPDETFLSELLVQRAGDVCNRNLTPCWKQLRGGVGWRFRDTKGTSFGVHRIVAKSPKPTRGTLLVKASNLARADQTRMPTGLTGALQGATRARVQVLTSNGDCFDLKLDDVKRADGKRFRAIGKVPDLPLVPIVP